MSPQKQHHCASARLVTHSSLDRVGTLRSLEEFFSPSICTFFVKSFKVMRFAQQNVIGLGKVSQRDLTRTVLTLGTRLVEFAAVERDLWIGWVHRLGASSALVGSPASTVEFLHAFLNARHCDRK